MIRLLKNSNNNYVIEEIKQDYCKGELEWDRTDDRDAEIEVYICTLCNKERYGILKPRMCNMPINQHIVTHSIKQVYTIDEVIKLLDMTGSTSNIASSLLKLNI